jgi:hypothetical protein
VIPKLLHQTAPTKTLTPEELRLQRRLARIMPDWQICLWDDDDNSRLMHEHFPTLAAKYDSIKTGVVRADIARYMYLYVFGGLYLDTDYKVLRPFEERWLTYPCVLPASRSHDYASADFLVCNSVMAAEPGYPLFADFIHFLMGKIDFDGVAENQIEKTSGPEGLTLFLVANRDRYSNVATPERRYFHPLITMKGFSFDRTHPSFGAHLCWGSWRSKSWWRAIKALLVRKVTSFT